MAGQLWYKDPIDCHFMKVDPHSVVVHESTVSFTTVDFHGDERTIYEPLDPDHAGVGLFLRKKTQRTRC
jgi:hypothetical protein